jgi:hypothetical protein
METLCTMRLNKLFAAYYERPIYRYRPALLPVACIEYRS